MMRLCAVCGQEETPATPLRQRGEEDICAACHQAQRRYDPETGGMLEWRHGSWVDITKTFGQEVARRTEARAETALQAAPEAQEALAEAVRLRVSAEEWQALIAFHTWCAARLGLTLEFYQRETGAAAYRFRSRTDAERQAWADGVAEDHL